MGDRQKRSVLSGRLEFELDRLALQDRVEIHRRLRQPAQPRGAAGEERRPYVEELVAAGALEPARGEERRQRPLLLGANRLLRVERRQPRRLAAELLPRLALGVVPEQPEGDERGDDPGQRNPGEEE